MADGVYSSRDPEGKSKAPRGPRDRKAVDVTTHLRARAVLAGAFLAVIGGVFVAPTAALAAGPTVAITGLSSGDIPSGGKTTLNYSITNSNPALAANVTVVISADGMSCDRCNFDDSIPAGGKKDYTANLTAGTVEPGEKDDIQLRIVATVSGPGGGSGSATRGITVRGPDKPQAVRQVSGKVKDQDGKSVSGASVAMRDSAGRNFNSVSGNDGGYSFRSTEGNPIAVGSLLVIAGKQGYKGDPVTAQGRADKSVNVPLTIKLIAATTSPTATPSSSPSATPTEEVTDEESEAATDEESAAAGPPTDKASGEDKGSGSMLFILLGGLLVAAGIGAIVLMFMRRKNNPDDDPDAAGAGGTVPPTPGRYGGGGVDETRLAAPVGGRGGDATMIAPRSGAPSMADAPTMIQRAPVVDPVDEFPDPYGAPMPQSGAYNAPGGWGSAPAAGAAGAAGAYGAAAGAAGTYGGATQYGGAPVPAQGGGYDDADANGYGAYDDRGGYAEQAPYEDPAGFAPAAAAPQRYDEPTGMYRPGQEAFDDQAGYQAPGYDNGYAGAPADDFAAPAQGHAYGAGGYNDQPEGDYGSWDGPGGGLDNGNGYGPQPGAGTYGGAAQSGGTYGGGQSGGTYGGGAAPAAGTYGGGAASGGTYGGAGTYGAAADDGYGNDPGYGDQGGYDQGGGYGGAPQGGGTYGGGGYGGEQPGYGDQGGYDQRGGTYGGDQQGGGRRAARPQPPEGSQPGQRRSLDWLDD
ncbi:hypothetical protein Asp14428_45780 [Actinoplanes sp. NBRC 14428]|nr:hypothetical protein Asp14428_45780 [Actinoplanes sp. NBRC 14428]